MSHFFRRPFVCALAALGLSACTSAADRPEGALAQFLTHVRRGRAEAVWAALSADSQRTLRQRHAALAKATGRPPSDDKAEILFGELRLTVPSEQDSIAVVSRLGPRVRLRITVPVGPSVEISMVQEDGAWKVDLIPALQPVKPTQPTEPTQPIEPTKLTEPTDQVAGADNDDAKTAIGVGDQVPAETAAGEPFAAEASGRPETSTPSASRP